MLFFLFFFFVFFVFYFFFNDTATTEIYTLSLHDALPILSRMIVITTIKTDRPIIVVEQGVKKIVIGVVIVEAD